MTIDKSWFDALASSPEDGYIAQLVRDMEGMDDFRKWASLRGIAPCFSIKVEDGSSPEIAPVTVLNVRRPMLSATKEEMDWEEFKRQTMQEQHWHTVQAGNAEDTNRYYLSGVRRSGAKVYAEGDTWQEVYDRLPDWMKKE